MKSFKRPRVKMMPQLGTPYLNRRGRVGRDIYRRAAPDRVLLPNQIYRQRRPVVEPRYGFSSLAVMTAPITSSGRVVSLWSLIMGC